MYFAQYFRPKLGLFRKKVLFVEKVQKVQKREFFLAPQLPSSRNFINFYKGARKISRFSTSSRKSRKSSSRNILGQSSACSAKKYFLQKKYKKYKDANSSSLQENINFLLEDSQKCFGLKIVGTIKCMGPKIIHLRGSSRTRLNLLLNFLVINKISKFILSEVGKFIV